MVQFANAPGFFRGRRVLFIHQNFPAQFVHLAAELVRQGAEVKALAIQGSPLAGVDFRRYAVSAESRLPKSHPASDVEVKAVRGLACAAAMRQLAAEGFRPDLVMAHPGWGEALFCKDIWPQAPLVAYGEFYYRADGSDYGFDPEFSRPTVESRMQLRMRNTALLHAYECADAILCPTPWQKSCLPQQLQSKAVVIFDGIDTGVVRPDPTASVKLTRLRRLVRPSDSVLTFVNRNLEPYRGFHTFMRALPEILAANPDTRCVIVGEDSVSYGSPPERHKTWREAMLAEVGERLPMDRVHFVGRVKYADYLQLLQVSTCHVYLTYPFVLSWSCIEALAAGCRGVAADTQPVGGGITHGVNGRLTGFFDVPGLAARVTEVLRDRTRFDPLAEAAVSQARAKYDLEGVCKPAQLLWLKSLVERDGVVQPSNGLSDHQGSALGAVVTT